MTTSTRSGVAALTLALAGATFVACAKDQAKSQASAPSAVQQAPTGTPATRAAAQNAPAANPVLTTKPAPAPAADGDADEAPTASHDKRSRVSDARCRVQGATVPDGVWFGAVTNANTEQLAFDVMCLYRGDEAKLAAAEDFQRLPSAQPTYIRNRAWRTRDIAVDAAAAVSELSHPNDAKPYAAWLEQRTRAGYGGVPVSLTVVNGRVSRIAEHADEDALGELVAFIPFGTGPDKIALDNPGEGNIYGASSLAVSADERRSYILATEENTIVVIENGRIAKHIPLANAPCDTSEIGVLPNGQLLLMGRYGNGCLTVINAAGKVLRTSWLRSSVDKGDFPGELVMTDAGAWVAFLDENLYRHMVDAQGRFVRAGRTLAHAPDRAVKTTFATTLDRTRLSVTAESVAGDPNKRSVTLEFEHPLIHLLGLASDTSGKLRVLSLHIWGVGDEQQSDAFLTVLGPNLERESQIKIPSPSSGMRVARYAEMAASGAVYYLDVRMENASTWGLAIRRYR